MIRKYNEWLKESEKMEPAPIAGAAQVNPTGNEVPLEEPASETEPIESPEQSAEISNDQPSEFSSNIEEWRSLDSTRRESIKSFKEKQEEFLEIPDDIRNNPVEESDKEKVETLKSELTELHTSMKSSWEAWDSFNEKMLGVSPEVDEEP
jgi:hypothetical protein